MTAITDRTPRVPLPYESASRSHPPKDVIIVHVARSLGEGNPLIQAAAGNWRVSDEAVKHLRYLVAVTTNNDVRGVFDITGHDAGVEHDDDGAQRVRFDLVPSDRTVVAPIQGKVQGNSRGYAAALISGDHPLPPEHTTPSSTTKPTREPEVCPACNVAHAGSDCW